MKFLRSTALLCPAAVAASLMSAASLVHAVNVGTPEAAVIDQSPEEEFDGENMGNDLSKKLGDQLGLEFVGYMRAGAYYAGDNLAKGHYGLGNLGYNRFGNEGDNYLEFGIGKKWNLSGVNAGIYWMPYIYNFQGTSVNGTSQAYAELSGFRFAPELKFWGGQRYHRIKDIHIIDNWIMEDGDNFGVGVDGIKIGDNLGKLNAAVYTEGTVDDSSTNSNAYRVNFQWRDIPLAHGGKLTLTSGIVNGDFADKSTSVAFGALYDQQIGESAVNALFLQGANGHADLRGKFYALNGRQTSTVGDAFICTSIANPDGSCPVANIAANPDVRTVTSTVYNPGAKQYRIVDSLTWQSGKFGGQAFMGYQTLKPSDSDATTGNFGVGGRVSYGIARYVKLYADLNYSTLKTDGSPIQRLHKETVGVAIAPNTKFWTRPELRFYVSNVGGNDAVRDAGVFNGKSRATLAGLQIEAWWE